MRFRVHLKLGWLLFCESEVKECCFLWLAGSAGCCLFILLLFRLNLVYLRVQVKLSFIVIPLHVGTYSGMKHRASQDHGATYIQTYNNEVKNNTVNLYTTNLLIDFDYKYTVYKC